jgi:hypothetical protein
MVASKKATYLIHDSENHIVVVCEAAGEFVPEGLPLCCGSGGGVGGIADDAAARGLLRWVVVSVVVVYIENGCQGISCVAAISKSEHTILACMMLVRFNNIQKVEYITYPW